MGSLDRHGLDHDRAIQRVAQGQMSHGGCGNYLGRLINLGLIVDINQLDGDRNAPGSTRCGYPRTGLAGASPVVEMPCRADGHSHRL